MTRLPKPDWYVTAAELADFGLTPADVRCRCPWATEYAAPDGSPCWLRDELVELLEKSAGGGEA
jgi:hypothetical protein